MNENVTMIFTKLDNGVPSNYVKTTQINIGQSKGELYLVPGDYNIVLMGLTYVGTLDLAEEMIEGQTIPGTQLNDSILTGYLMFDNTTSGSVSMSKEDLDKGEMKIYYPGFKPSVLEKSMDLAVIGAMIDASKEERELLNPEFG